MKYSEQFNRDFKWYLSVRKKFNFDGGSGNWQVISEKEGVSAKKAFFKWDSNGIVIPTKHPNILHSVLITKGSVNLHIKMYSEDRAKGLLPKIEFDLLCKEINAPDWFINAVENQKNKHYE